MISSWLVQAGLMQESMPGVRSNFFVPFVQFQISTDATIGLEIHDLMSLQVAHFVTPFNYDNLDGIHAALNGLLPSDVRVREVSPASAEFHARFSAKSKVYHYKIYSDTFMDPFQRHFAYHNAYKLNSTAIREAAKYFVGKHDFSAFANASRNDRVPNPVKNIFRFDVKEMVLN